MKRSPRLEGILASIKKPSGQWQMLADIGTDHGFIPIYACLDGLTEKAIACDISPRPLAQASANIQTHRLFKRIETRLGDGLVPLKPGEADCLVISGMGGMAIIEIMQKSRETAFLAKRLVLQPQHDIPRLRKTLHEAFFEIQDEGLIREENRFYHIITAAPAKKVNLWTDSEYRLGKHLLNRGGNDWQLYLEQQKAKLTSYISALGTEPCLRCRKKPGCAYKTLSSSCDKNKQDWLNDIKEA
jgi:tRNA (adenine22-N1)-methyltransferase